MYAGFVCVSQVR